MLYGTYKTSKQGARKLWFVGLLLLSAVGAMAQNEVNPSQRTQEPIQRSDTLTGGEKSSLMQASSLSENQLYALAQAHCADVTKQLENAKLYKLLGVVFLSVGVPLTAAGLVTHQMAAMYPDSESALNTAGAACMGIGLPVMGAGIPLFVIGKNQKKKALKLNAPCQEAFTVSLSNSGQGIGLGMNF